MLLRFVPAAVLLGVLLAPAASAQIATRTLVTPNPLISGDFGTAIAAVPDVDGDSRADLLVGASGEDGAGLASSGRAYVFSGSTGALLRTLVSPNPEASGFFGGAVAGVPDADGDGRGDLLVGAFGEDGGALNAGRAYLFSGASGALLRTLASPNPEANGVFGRAVAGVPDVNGDGRGDLFIGADREDGGAGGAGRAYLFSGATGTHIRTYLSPNPAVSGSFGSAVAGVQDANGDGPGDLLVGTTEEVAGAPGAGRAYLFSGASSALLRTVVTPNPVSFGFFGRAVAGVPDANGDGRGDLLIGARDEDGEAESSGRAYLFSGASGALLRTLVSPNQEADGFFGWAVAGVPDANGDGRGDLLVGAAGENGGTLITGRAYLFSGASGALLRTLVSPNQGASGSFGSAVAGVPDVNADGRGELFVGAYREDSGAIYSGRAYLFGSGPKSLSLTGPQGWRLLALPLASTPADLLDEAWTQGSTGADLSDGDPNVYGYTESVPGLRAQGYAALPDLRTADLTGQGRAVYVFEDDDLVTPGVQGGFPKSLGVFGHTRAGHPATFPVSYSPSGTVQEDGWNLVGNPYDLGLDWDAAGWTKTRLDNTIYVFNRALGVYQTWNGTAGSLGDGIVATFQGFWVKANAASPALVAPAAARVATPPPTTPLGPSLGLRLAGTLGGTAVADEAFVAFVPGGTDALDPFDAYELAPFSDTFAALYAEGPGALLDVEARAPLGGAAVFTLSAAAVAAGQAAGGAFTLSWPDLAAVPASWRLTLTDVATGAAVDLRAQPSYTFTLAAGLAPESVPSASLMTPPVPTPLAFADGLAPPSRFLLRVEDAAVAGEGGPAGTLSLAAGPNPTSGPTRLAYVLPAPASVRLSVFDALGREVARLADGDLAAGTHDAVLDAGRLAPGVYVVRLTSGAAAVVQRLTVVR